MNTTNTKINIRIDRDTKEQAKATLESLGLDLSTGVKMFLKSVINSQSIPFEIRTENGYTLQQESEILQSAKESQQQYRNGQSKTYTSASEMIDDMINWDDDGNYVRN